MESHNELVMKATKKQEIMDYVNNKFLIEYKEIIKLDI